MQSRRRGARTARWARGSCGMLSRPRRPPTRFCECGLPSHAQCASCRHFLYGNSVYKFCNEISYYNFNPVPTAEFSANPSRQAVWLQAYVAMEAAGTQRALRACSRTQARYARAPCGRKMHDASMPPGRAWLQPTPAHTWAADVRMRSIPLIDDRMPASTT
jgi:hypothetical protein